jgi:hypothetical protein
VECALKACVAKGMLAEEFPDKSFADKCWTHNLVQLYDAITDRKQLVLSWLKRRW